MRRCHRCLHLHGAQIRREEAPWQCARPACADVAGATPALAGGAARRVLPQRQPARAPPGALRGCQAAKMLDEEGGTSIAPCPEDAAAEAVESALDALHRALHHADAQVRGCGAVAAR